jgi:MoaA/NifB/PqqE/SkfB family radical SAM enzyme
MSKFSYFDITPSWKKSHPHLRIQKQYLESGHITQEECPACGHSSAVRVKAVISIGDFKIRTPVLVCCECETYTAEVDHAVIPETFNPADIVVDAKLWSSGPSFLNLEPTTRCNFECWYCVGRHMEQADIAVDRFVRILDNFPGMKTLALVGEGEPLMHKEFFDMVKIARDRGITVGTISNGSTFSKSNIEKSCASGINYISISIDSTNPEQFAASRIGGNLEKVLQNIQNLVAYRDKHGYKYPKIGLKGTLFAESIDELPKIVDLAKAHGVEIFEGFQPLNPMRTYIPIYPECKKVKLSEIDTVRHKIQSDTPYALSQLQSIQSFAEQEGIELDNNGTPNGMRPGCDEQWIYALLSGDVTPCCQIKDPINPKWNLSDYTIEEIQKDPDYQNLRFNLWNGLFPQMCKGCWKTGVASFSSDDALNVEKTPGNADDNHEKEIGILSRVKRLFS